MIIIIITKNPFREEPQNLEHNSSCHFLSTYYIHARQSVLAKKGSEGKRERERKEMWHLIAVTTLSNLH